MESGIEPSAQPPTASANPDSDQPRDAWWSLVGVLVAKRRLLVIATVLAAVVSIVISLLLPKWYLGQARVMLPTPTGGGAITALLGDLDPSASALLGTSSGDYVRYMAILTSGTMADRMIEEFDLMEVYETADAAYPRLKTRKILEGNLDFEIDREFDFLQINVLDRSPERAAAMANYLVSELNRLNGELVSENAATYRKFVQQRYDATIDSLDVAMIALKEYQQEYGVIELEQQAEAFLTVLAGYRAAAFEAEVEYEALVMDFGADNPTVKSAQNRVQAARSKERELLEGQDPLMPVAIADIPEVGYGYAKALRDVLIYQKIIEFARPLLEQAIFEEQKVTPAVQVLDQALVPEKKDRPKRMLIVAAFTISVLMLVVIYLLVLDWIRRNGAYIGTRIDRELKRQK